MFTASQAQPPLSQALSGFEHVNRYWDRRHKVFAAKVLPGEYYVTRGDEMVTTVLGSCVAACARDRVFGVGGMNHFMLPVSKQQFAEADSVVSAATRYGNHAMEHLINAILGHGGHRRNLEVKVFGGGKIISEMTHVGLKNIEFVRCYLRTEGIEIAAEDLGDRYPRKVLYFPSTGRVLVRKLRSLHNDTIVRRERSYQHEIGNRPVAGEVELFD